MCTLFCRELLKYLIGLSLASSNLTLVSTNRIHVSAVMEYPDHLEAGYWIEIGKARKG